MSNAEFLDKVISILQESLRKQPQILNVEPCDRYKPADSFRYMRDQMSREEREAFESHSIACLSCLVELMKAHQVYVEELERHENKLLLDRTMKLMDAIDEQKRSFMHVVARVSAGVLKVIRTSGEMMMPAPLAQARGDIGLLPEDQQIKIVKELATDGLSVQTTLRKGDAEGEVILQMSLYDRKSSRFVSEADIRLEGPSGQERAKSNIQGELTLKLSAPGYYRIILQSHTEPNVIAEISLYE